jgi:hypothetical protein
MGTPNNPKSTPSTPAGIFKFAAKLFRRRPPFDILGRACKGLPKEVFNEHKK